MAKDNIVCSRKKVLEVMRDLNIRPSWVKLSPYGKLKKLLHKKFKHRLKRKFNPKKINRYWVGDITYLPTTTGWLYLAVVMDLASRKIIGYSMSTSPNTELVSKAFQNALSNRQPIRWRLMFHSDQGVQYSSNKFSRELKDCGVLQSMSRRGECWDNAVIESFFGSMKKELNLKKSALISNKEMYGKIFNYIETWYNPKRRHTTLNYMSPVEYEQKYAA